MHADPTDKFVVYVNVTDAQGVLLERFGLTADDLKDRPSHIESIGQRVLGGLPGSMVTR